MLWFNNTKKREKQTIYWSMHEGRIANASWKLLSLLIDLMGLPLVISCFASPPCPIDLI